jgi:NAD(P)-dependent dehydrogenase (short-subunit alcohol dehydrogenase family)
MMKSSQNDINPLGPPGFPSERSETWGSSQMTGKLCLVTGANTGHGKAVAGALARMGATVMMGCRNIERAEAARTQLIAESGNDCIFVLPLDLADQRSVRAAADRFQSEHSSLDVLVNNAGAWWADRRLSPDGIELVWATNVLGPLFLTQLLLPSLRASGGGRIVNVSSIWADGLDLDDVEFARRPYSGALAYRASKQAARMVTWILADQLRGEPVVVNALSPGFMKTELGRSAPLGFRIFLALLRPFQISPERGADTAIWLASSLEGASLTNQFFVKRSPVPCKFRDPAACERLSQMLRLAMPN